MPRNIYLFLSLSLSLVLEYLSLPISSLSLRPVQFISFYHCKKNLDHIVFPSRSFVSNLSILWINFFVHNQYSKFFANAYNTETSACTETWTLTTHASIYCQTLSLLSPGRTWDNWCIFLDYLHPTFSILSSIQNQFIFWIPYSLFQFITCIFAVSSCISFLFDK